MWLAQRLLPSCQTPRIVTVQEQVKAMTICKRFAKSLKSYVSQQDGNVAILFALSVVPMFLAAGAAIDFARFSAAQNEVQSALDAASLAAASAPAGSSTAQRISIGNETFKANMVGGVAGNLGITASFTVQKEAVVAKANGSLPMSLMKVGGLNAVDIGVETEVNIVSSRKAEIALVLDYSGSMNDPVKGGQKYVLMSAAAKKLVNDLATMDKDKVKVGLVPFSQYVHTTLPRNFVAVAGTGAWTGCTQDRGAPFNLTSDEPDGSADAKWAQPLNTEHASYTCSGFAAKSLKIVPLTNDFDRVTSQLSSMRPYGYTHISLGMEFGYHLVSKSAPYTEGVEFGDKDTDKYIVLLTDGSQTENAKGPGGIRSVPQGGKNLAGICANAKASGVTVITMAFDLTDDDPSKAEATKARLRDCASSAADYFDANDGADLAKAFDSIRTQVSQNIFINK
jgi:Flp pilus assembly protein TadG